MDETDTRVNDPRWTEFNRGFNALAARFGGRPLLNQTKQLSREIVERTLGADWDRFLEIRQGEDPEGRFLSEYIEDLMVDRLAPPSESSSSNLRGSDQER